MINTLFKQLKHINNKLQKILTFSSCTVYHKRTLLFEGFHMKLVNHFSNFDCNNCHRKTKYPECNFCHRMVNYFQIFDIPETYQIDPQVIKNLSKDLQKQFHPDTLQSNTECLSEQHLIKYSSYINEAKATLLNNLKRALYLLELKGVELDEHVQVNDTNFMMEIFELQERIENASILESYEIKQRLDELIVVLQKELGNFFQSENLQKCKEFITKYQYIHRALINIKKRISYLHDEQKKKQ